MSVLTLPRVLLTAILGAVLVAVPVRAQDYDDYDDDYSGDYEDDAPDPDEYEDALEPHGEWVDVPQYGHVWHPAVAIGWRPYSAGYWAWSPHGWLWVSYEPWAWTFHYGRWAFAPVWGWVWVPGTVWGPAWVDWYWGNGYVGWAPLGPFVTHVTVVNHFVFVRDHDFCARRVHHHFVHHRSLPTRVIHHWRQRDHRAAPDRHRIERVSRHRIERFDHRPQHTLAPGHRQRRDRDSHIARQREQRSPERGHGGQIRRDRPAAGPHDPGRSRPPRIDRQGGREHVERGPQRGTDDRMHDRQAPGRGQEPREPGRGHEPREPRRSQEFRGATPQRHRGGQGERQGERPTMGSLRPAPTAVPGGVNRSPRQGGHGGVSHGQGAERAPHGGQRVDRAPHGGQRFERAPHGGHNLGRAPAGTPQRHGGGGAASSHRNGRRFASPGDHR